ncbi:MAG: HAMP domain-containing histidine kinase [Hyphomonadaceae bacterium]|nr:HAMP domain-containing histidine kinase [Hyphomonadaceae bacterium]
MQRSLRLRLLLGAGIAIFAALAIAWVAMGYLFERHAQRQLEAELSARGAGLIPTITADAAGAIAIDPLPADPRYETPASGLYWQVRGPANLLRSRSLWDETLNAPGAASGAEWRGGQINGPFGQRLVFAERQVQLDVASAPLTILVAADASAITTARNAFTRDLMAFLGLLWIALAAAAWIQVELGLRPLEHVRAALGGLRKQASARLSQHDYPAEAAPLANAINDLATARERDLEQARRRAADLAHSLKTPLAALAAQSRRAREAGASDAADGLDRAIVAATRAVGRELARTRAAASAGGSANGAAVIQRLIQVIERTEAGSRLQFENAVSTTPLPLNEDVLTELAGPLLENASRFARARVRISGGAHALTIEDDGPGMNDGDAAEALSRGKRLDEAGDGHGLGLAIANDLAQASGATMTLTRGDLGGLNVILTWPDTL